MSRKLTVLSLILLLTALWGCRQEDTVSLTLRDQFLAPTASAMFIKVTATGDWTLSLEYSGSEKGWARVSPESGTGTMTDVRLYCEANPSEEPRSVTIVLTPSSGSSVRESEIQCGKPGPSVRGTYGYDQAGMLWLELPAMETGDGRELLVHNMKGGKYSNIGADGVRNWSCYWDYGQHLSLWVAYPHNNSLKGSGSGRSNAWGWDALLPHNLQPDLTQRSYGGGWTRGHQIPSADRLGSYDANVSTFVPTNMTPQDYDFNAGVWLGLENKVRSYASRSDTLYVVTGCLFDESTTYTGSNSGFQVKVPTHYFKALLAMTSSQYATDGFLAAGFLLPHSGSIGADKCLDYIRSIDQLEKETGIDFFPNLRRILGAKADAIEAAQPNRSFWN